jgi:hypothetical protein
MKKFYLIILLIILAIPAFPQEMDGRTPFHGIWYGLYGDVKIFYIFIDDVFITNLDDGFFSHYSVEDNNLILTNPRELDIDGWKKIQDEDIAGNIQYVFSGDKLILVFDGEPIAFSRYYTDFFEWR